MNEKPLSMELLKELNCGPINFEIRSLIQFIQSRERKAFEAAWSYGGDASVEDYDKVFDDYKKSPEYSND